MPKNATKICSISVCVYEMQHFGFLEIFRANYKNVGYFTIEGSLIQNLYIQVMLYLIIQLQFQFFI